MTRAEVGWLNTSVGRVRAGAVPWVTEELLASLKLDDRKGKR
ncbi:hypothetical protein [Rhodococcus spongiicola]|nr:hypothetical protein [Rhodococcus spongiicola]